MFNNFASDHLVGGSRWTDWIRRRVVQIGSYRYSVLICGPTGTGKEPQDEGPSPRTAFIRTEDEQQILDALPDEVLRQIATLRSQGHTNDEIAMILGCARRTVERKVERIRRVLSKTA